MSVLTIRHAKLVQFNKIHKDQTFFSDRSRMKSLKNKFKGMLEEFVCEANLVLEDLFPSLKQQEMLDYVLYNVSATGIQSISTERLTERFECSVSTVRRLVASLKHTGFLDIARIASRGNAGTYVFILKTHENYPKIMDELFSIKVDEVTHDTSHDTSIKPANTHHIRGNERKKVSTLFTELKSYLFIKNFKSFNWLEEGTNTGIDKLDINAKPSKLLEEPYNWLEVAPEKTPKIKPVTISGINWLESEEKDDEMDWYNLNQF
jgi:hypothetical protein